MNTKLLFHRWSEPVVFFRARDVLVLCSDVGDPCRNCVTAHWLMVVLSASASASSDQHACFHDICLTWLLERWSQERLRNRTVEEMFDVPVPQIRKEMER